uniref:Sulfatase N-terminal domain-containing protein n=1 Tax=Tetradesmus obliquus TaxID=3088 RepID=A0A383VJP5_TETOB|eukprot:jgi/Sobl393_1/14124/SZX65745.1
MATLIAFAAVLVSLGAACAADPAAVRLGQVPIPALPAGQKPNFIVILTDDQGWDDIGLHNPDYVNTPNLDRFIKGGTFFSNFYVTPQCAQTRAALMTGRQYPRTGTMLVHAGWDFMNTAEATAGEVMSAAGYRTAQFGKWHNREVAGYEPWSVGFHEGELPAANKDCPVNRNGVYVLPDSISEAGAGAGAGVDAAASRSSISRSTSVNRKSSITRSSSTTRSTAASRTSSTSSSTNSSSSMAIASVNKLFKGDMAAREQTEIKMMDGVLKLLGKHSAAAAQGSKQPFFIYHAPHAIHVTPVRLDGKFKKVRFSPPEFKVKYHSEPKYKGISENTLDAWAMLEYLDSVLGRLFKHLKDTGLDKNTYVMIMSDNGSFLMPDEPKKKRMPSRLTGTKSEVFEGGVRNFLAVQGPGVQAGVTDSTLLDITDILPTMADLAGISSSSKHLPWDGRSFKNLLVPSSSSSSSSSSAVVTAGGSRGTSLATKEQQERVLFLLGPQCWDANAVPLLTADREVDKRQTLLDYDRGGMPNHIWKWLPSLKPSKPAGFEACVGARYKEYKWVGVNNKVYRFDDESHLENEQTEVPPAIAAAISSKLSDAARSWWKSMLAEPHSFNKPTFYLGLGSSLASNVLAAGAHERTPGNVTLLAMGASGFSSPGDRMCYKVQVMTAGTYDVTLMYTSRAAAAVKLSFGTYQAIRSGAAASITAQLPRQASKMEGFSVGSLTLPASGTKKTELCLELASSSSPGSPAFSSLANIRFTRIAQTPASQGQLRGGSGASSAGAAALDSATLEALRAKCNWVGSVNVAEDVDAVMESMFSPYDAEDTDSCAECQPQL